MKVPRQTESKQVKKTENKTSHGLEENENENKTFLGTSEDALKKRRNQNRVWHSLCAFFHYRFLFTKVTKQEGAKKEKRKKKSMRDIIHSCRNYFSINAMFCFYKILT